jgi:hypothetical protein
MGKEGVLGEFIADRELNLGESFGLGDGGVDPFFLEKKPI